MRIAYANAFYLKNGFRGADVHVKQFVDNVVALGHEIWTWPGDEHPAARRIPATRIGRLRALRRMDVIYFRMEDRPPGSCQWMTTPMRQLIGSPPVVWEFNVSPEYGKVIGRSDHEVEQSIQSFRSYGRHCDLAIGVSKTLTEYARDKLGIPRVLTVPNGSDPDMFRPDVPAVSRVPRNEDHINVVWIGSADLSWHNFDLMCEAARLLQKRSDGGRVQFHIVGKGLRRAGDMPAQILYHGTDDYEAIPRWLAAMDVGLCLYRPGIGDSSSPLKLFDYMASGLAVVGTVQPQVHEVFSTLGQLDLLVPSDDPKALADVLLGLASNRDRIRSLGKAGRQLVIDHYNWRRAARDTIEAIESLIRERRCTRSNPARSF